jgi:hypothetical protein
MATTVKQQQEATKVRLIASLNRKQADLDMLDDQIMGMDDAMPMDTAPSAEFDLLTQKREELEEDIRTMREGVQLISEWEKFKGGQWSEDVKMQLNSMDSNIASAAGPAGQPMDLGVPASGLDAGLPPAAPMAPGAPAPALEAPIAPEAPAPTIPALETETAPVEEELEPTEQPLPAPVASVIRKKNNYEAQNKKGVTAQEKPTMANEQTKPSLKEGLASQKSKREAIKKEAQSRVASAWTIAKTMLPTAPAGVQKAFASTLLASPTKVLTAALRQTAVNAHWSKFAEEFKKVHKVELNDLMEDPSVLSKEKSAVESEIKGEAKAAAAKVADDRKENGTQPEKYDDGRKGSEPAEIDAGKAAEREADTVNKSEGGSNKVKEAAAKKAGESCAECKKLGETCPGCKSAAVTKKADEPMDMPPAPDAVPAMDAAPAGDVPPAPEVVPGEEGVAEEAATVLTEEKKLDIHEKIEEAEQAIQSLEEEILEEGNEELNIENIFNEEDMDDKVSSLANEGDNHAAGDENDDFFAPSAAAEMESSLEGDHFGSMDEIFSMQGADADPLYALIAGDLKTAAQVEGMEVLPAFSGELANHFNEQSNDGRDTESDHEGDILAEAAEAVKPEQQGAKRLPQDSEPKLEESKAAAKKPAAIRHIKSAAAGTSRRPVNPVAAALFADGDDF